MHILVSLNFGWEKIKKLITSQKEYFISILVKNNLSFKNLIISYYIDLRH